MKKRLFKFRKKMIWCTAFFLSVFSHHCFAIVTGYPLNLGTVTFEKSYWDVGGWLYVTDNLGGNKVLWNTDTNTANTVAVAWTPQYTDYISLSNCPPTGMSCIAVATPVEGLYMAFSFVMTYDYGWVSGIGTPGQLVTVNSIASDDNGTGATTYAKMNGIGGNIVLSEAYYSFYQKGSSFQTTPGTDVSLTNAEGRLKGVGLYMPDISGDKHRDNIYIDSGIIIVKPATCGIVGDNYNLTVNMDNMEFAKIYNTPGIYPEKKGTTAIEIECHAGIKPTVSFTAKNIETDNSGAQTLIGLMSGSTAKGIAIQLKSGNINSGNALDITGATSYNFAGNAVATTQGESRTMDLDFYYYKKSGIDLEPGTFSAILTANLTYN